MCNPLTSMQQKQALYLALHMTIHILIFLIGVFSMLNLAHLCSCKHTKKVCILARCDYTCETDIKFNTPPCIEPLLNFFPLICHYSFTSHQPPCSNWNHMNKLMFKCQQSSPWVILLQQEWTQCSSTEFSVNNGNLYLLASLQPPLC